MCSCVFSINNPTVLSLDKRRIYNVPLYKGKHLDNLFSYYLVDNFSVCFVYNAGINLTTKQGVREKSFCRICPFAMFPLADSMIVGTPSMRYTFFPQKVFTP